MPGIYAKYRASMYSETFLSNHSNLQIQHPEPHKNLTYHRELNVIRVSTCQPASTRHAEIRYVQLRIQNFLRPSQRIHNLNFVLLDVLGDLRVT